MIDSNKTTGSKLLNLPLFDNQTQHSFFFQMHRKPYFTSVLLTRNRTRGTKKIKINSNYKVEKKISRTPRGTGPKEVPEELERDFGQGHRMTGHREWLHNDGGQG